MVSRSLRERQTDRQSETDRQTDRQTETERERVQGAGEMGAARGGGGERESMCACESERGHTERER